MTSRKTVGNLRAPIATRVLTIGRFATTLILMLSSTFACGVQAAEPDGFADSIDYNRDILPILSTNCFECHGPDESQREAELRLDTRSGIFGYDGHGGAVTPGDPAQSSLFTRITAEDADDRMPPPDSNRHLSGDEVELLRRWIVDGAVWGRHWSFIAPERPELPSVVDRNWPVTPVDHFVLARLEAEGLSPSESADERTLLRRVTLDLTGLPPTPDEIDAYLADATPEAYEKVVDRILSSPRLGERLALEWLDAARYADTFGYHEDYHRDMWVWRDWVIDSLNSDMPFDEFTVEQLAGDLLPEASTRQQVATGFNRLHGVTSSGIPEEYRVEYDLDRVKTTATVWLGLTVGCAQCHDHKYDPITQKEFYEFYAHFNNVDDPAIMGNQGGNVGPLISFVEPRDEARLARFAHDVTTLESQISSRATELDGAFVRWRRERRKSVGSDPAPRAPKDGLVVHYPFDEEEGRNTSCRVTDRDVPVHSEAAPDAELWVPGRLGGALKFDGKTSVALGDQLNFDTADTFSFGAWVFREKGGCVISRMDNPNGTRGWSLTVSSDGRVGVRLANHHPDDGIRLFTTKKFDPKEWHHVFVTYDGSMLSSGINVYVDGEAWLTNATHDTLTETIRTSKPAFIGQQDSRDYFRGTIDDVRVYARVLRPVEVRALSTPLGELLVADEAESGEALRRYFLENRDEEYRRLADTLDSLRSEEASYRKRATRSVMVMQEMSKPRETFVLQRGQYNQLGEKVKRRTPSVLPPLPENAPADRLGVARWLTQEGHPLTGRVAVNRYWQMIFGTGIVATQEDFGTQGERPSHPALLDWLAVEFADNGWNVKALLKMIVMSSTYRQTSRVSDELAARDPQNRLLTRGPRHRLPGEFIRDQALAAGGLLVGRIGGPSVRPYQPRGLWVESATRAYQQGRGEDLYRRSIYTYWKRSVPPPNLLIFDAPNRETCSVRRQRTNTPLMALVLMNDPTYVEAARALAERMMTEAGEDASERASLGFLLATGRRPETSELNVLVEVQAEQQRVFVNSPEAARKLLGVGDSRPSDDLDPVQLAAWTAVASMVLNLDETITKE